MARIKIFLKILAVILLLEFAVLYAYSYWVISEPPSLSSLDQNTLVYDRNGNELIQLQGRESRVPVALERVPLHVQKAFIAIEDERFYLHRGVDPRAILRALYRNIMKGEIVQGGSTITQQVIKTYYLTAERTYARKFREALLSLQYENNNNKDKILEMYLNGIYLGAGAYGVQEASRVYFGKDAGELSLTEGALLAGITRAPGEYDPYINPVSAMERRNTVISKMAALNLVDQAVAVEAIQSPLGIIDRRQSNNKLRHSFYVDHVIEEAISILGENAVYGRGLKIRTAFDPHMQSVADKVITEEKFPDDIIQGALVLLESKKGEIVSMVGGRNYQITRGFNRATHLRRQPGSAFKPISVYGPAFELGYRQDSIIQDSFRSYGGYIPRNSGGEYWGGIIVRKALQWSRNAAAVWLLNEIGVDQGYKFALRLGIKLDEEDRHLALALGGLNRGISPLDMAGAYSSFDNGGFYISPHAIIQIEDEKGEVIYRSPEPVQVMSPNTAQNITEVLKAVVSRGTGTMARVSGHEAAGKTGTTEIPDSGRLKGLKGNKDAWFVGYVGGYTCSVWVGYDERDMDRFHYLKMYGGDKPAVIFNRVMSDVLN